MRARIYQPARNAMQSGTGKSKLWVLELVPVEGAEADPLMGWPGGTDVHCQIRLRFDSKEAALDYAREKGLDVTVLDPKKRKPVIRPNGYGDNFATNRRQTWTH